MRRIALLFACVYCFLAIYAQNDYRQRRITMNDGLAANAVRHIVQDKHGYIWFGTDNGLCRYDGRNVLPYRIPELGMNQYVSSLIADGEGLYVGTEKGVFFLSFERRKFEKLPADLHSTTSSMCFDKEGCLWISTLKQGVWRYTPSSQQVKHYNDFKASQGGVAQVFADNSNQIWTVANSGPVSVNKLNRLQDRFEPVMLECEGGYNSLCMTQTRDGRIWLGTWENGLMLLNPDGKLERKINPEIEKAGWHIHALYQRQDDEICIGCDDGAISYNPKTGEWCRMDDSRFVYTLLGDTEGGFWIGTFYGGVSYLSPVGKRFDGYAAGNGLPCNVISRFSEDKQGRVWVASDDGGLLCFLPGEGRFIGYPHQNQLSILNVHALCLDGNNELWIGTYTDGVLVMNLETGSLRQYKQTSDPNSLDNSSAYAIFLDSHKQLWVGTMEGLNRFDREHNRFERIGKTGAIIIDIDEDKKGNLWLSTQGEGLWQYNRKSGKLRNYRYDSNDKASLPDNQVNCVLVDEGGQLLIGTFSGLCTYDSSHDSFRRIGLDVPSQDILSIIEDHGALWLTTERGIVKYVPDENVQRFTLHDGLVSEQFQPNSGLKTSDGRMFFGSTSGFNAFYPHQIKANHVIPPVYITSIHFMNKEEPDGQSLPLDLSLTKELSFGYDDARMLILSFASLSYCAPEKIQYAYMLDGFDRDWNYVDNLNRATYTNIPAGTYIFRVKATNNDGVWSTNEATLKIIVRPPFWWSWYAKLFYLFLLVAAIWSYIRYRLKRAERIHQQELQKLNEQKKKEVREARLDFIAQNPTDNKFLIRMNEIIEENFSNTDLNVDFLAKQLHISRSGLFAKIKTLADVTPNEMIQIVRLKRAAQLLREGTHQVSEVGYMVGFSNPSYFSKCFQKQYGIRPAEYMKSEKVSV